MKTKLLWMIALLALATAAGAQDWQKGWKGNVEYNCDAVMGAVAEVGALYYRIFGTDDLTPGDGEAEHYVLTDVNVTTVAESLLGRAPGCGKAFVADDDVVDIYEPERWKLNITGDYFYQCDVVRRIVAGFGDLDFRRDGDRHHTVIGYYQEDAPDCMPPYVVTKVHSDVYACADSDCEKIDRIMRWLAWPVVGWSEGWYELALEDKTGFVAEADVAPGPYGLLQVDEQHVLQYAECVIVPQIREKDYRLVAILKAGPAVQEIEVALYKPAADTALDIYDEIEGEFSNNGQPYILQMHDPGSMYPTGVYIVELTWDGLTFRYGVNVQEHNLYYIHVYCNRPESE